MAPEIEQLGPGSCPICSMALEIKDPVVALQHTDNTEFRVMTSRYWGGPICPILAVTIAMGDMIPGWQVSTHLDPALNAWIQAALSALAVFWAGACFFVRSWQPVRTLSSNMSTLISIAIGVAVPYSLFVLLFTGTLLTSFTY